MANSLKLNSAHCFIFTNISMIAYVILEIQKSKFAPGVSLSTINTPCSSYSYFSPPTKAKIEAVCTPLERYLSRNPP